MRPDNLLRKRYYFLTLLLGGSIIAPAFDLNVLCLCRSSSLARICNCTKPVYFLPYLFVESVI